MSKLIEPRYNVEYQFKFYSEKTRKTTVVRYVLDGIEDNGNYRFFDRAHNNIIRRITPKRFSFNYRFNLIKETAIAQPSAPKQLKIIALKDETSSDVFNPATFRQELVSRLKKLTLEQASEILTLTGCAVEEHIKKIKLDIKARPKFMSLAFTPAFDFVGLSEALEALKIAI